MINGMQEGYMHSRNSRKKASYVLLGIIIALAFVLLTGASHMQPHNGRYRMSVITRGNFTDIYVIDTTTGVVKYLGKDEGKPFEQVGGK
jgi:hypothetical protein